MINPKIKLFKKQMQAMKILQDPLWQGEVMYGGGARGGKSYLSANWLVSCSLNYPESQWLLGFEELKHLRRTTLPDLIKVIKYYTEPENGARWQNTFKINLQDMILEFINGSKIFLSELANLPSDPNFDRLGSLSLTGFAVDEAQRVSKTAIDTLQARLSLTKGDGWEFAPKALYTCNPKKNWTYRDFWKPLVKEKQDIPNKRFITSLYTDNPFINHSQYRQQVVQSKNRVQIERLLNGNFEYDDDPAKIFEHDDIQNLFTNPVKEGKEKYLIVDVARMGSDKTVIGYWQGLVVKKIFEYAKQDTKQTADVINNLSQKLEVKRSNICIDEDGVGGGVVDNLPGCKGFVNNSTAIDNRTELEKYQGKPKLNYANLKTQCYFELARLTKEALVRIETESPEIKEKIGEELEQVKQANVDKDTKINLVSKDIVKANIGRSPDISDMLMMRMYFEVHKPPKPLAMNFSDGI